MGEPKNIPLPSETYPAKGQNDSKLGGGFNMFSCSPLFGEDFQFDEYFFRWVGSTTNQQRKQFEKKTAKTPAKKDLIFGKVLANMRHAEKTGRIGEEAAPWGSIQGSLLKKRAEIGMSATSLL